MKSINEFHEFTWDMVRALPRAYYHELNNIPYKVNCKPGLSDIYYFSSNVEEQHIFHEVNDSSTYSHSRPHFTLNEWTPPPLKGKYKGVIKFEKPTVVIQNKYTLEWNSGPFNYFPLEVLDELFKYLNKNYTIIYIRPLGNSKGYYKDQNKIQELNDYKFIADHHPYVYTLEHFLQEYPDLTYNQIQFYLEASSEKHLTVSGGSACVASYFGGDVIIFDSPNGTGAGRGIWKTDSWLKYLSGANIIGVNDYKTLLNTVENRW